ncbi:carboxymuconolactone decarboxylase family protein [Promicromonospora sp. NPDC050249]|uniref:carboxymuconolactone decarboxylase family protein n=1 Tax=Promicromonospora sp. NPDC050249 TaxID=3154743 RepID=UPI0033F96B8D
MMNETGHDAAPSTVRARAGRARFALNFGVDEATAQRLMTERAGPEYTAEAYEAAGGLGWQGNALTDRDRSIAVISALVTSHIIDDRLDVYLNLARRNGIDEDGLTQLMILLTAYIGQPLPSAAMSAIRRTDEHR